MEEMRILFFPSKKEHFAFSTKTQIKRLDVDEKIVIGLSFVSRWFFRLLVRINTKKKRCWQFLCWVGLYSDQGVRCW